jgi:UPF0716 protein FxsA
MRLPLSVIVILPILAEIATFILVGKAIGVLPTLGLVLLGIVTGVMLLRRQGVATLRQIQAEIRANGMPARALAEGATKAVAALLLILPGFLSDLFALALFVPPIRSRILKAMTGGHLTGVHSRRHQSSRRPGVIDLDRTEYAARQASGNADSSPWRSPPGGTAT